MMIKKATAFCLAVLMLLSFSGCKLFKKKAKVEPLSVSLSFVRYDYGMKDSFLKNKDRFIKTFAPTYGMSEEQANDLLKNPNSYDVFTIDTTISNREENNYTFDRINVNGKHDGIWICGKSVNGQVGVPGKTTTEVFVFSFIANTQKLSASAIYKTLADLTFSVYYYDTPADDDDVVNESEYKVLIAENCVAAPDNSAVEGELKVSLDSIEDGDDFARLYQSDKSGLSVYGFDSTVLDRYAAKDSKWECYLLNVKITNGSAEGILFFGNTASNNGTGGVWVAPKSIDGDEFGVSAGTETTVAFLLLVDPDAAGGATLTDAVKTMNLSLRYIVDRTDIDQVDTCLRVQNTIKIAV